MMNRLAAALTAGLIALAGPASGQTVRHHHRRTPDASGPQTAIPAPRPNGDADVPGGSAKNGVIEPPAVGTGRSVIAPPGSATNQPLVVPK